MATATELLQDFSAGRIVSLYTLDATARNTSSFFRFTNTTDGAGGPILFDGDTYVPIPIDVEGFEREANGALPRPKIKVSNANSTLTSVMEEYNDLIGAKLTRVRTFERFLDTGSEPDATQTFGTEIYNISRKTQHNKVFIEFELATSMDQQHLLIPRRQMFRRSCRHRYRHFNTQLDDFDYTGVTCPYSLVPSFDRNGLPCEPEFDQCAKHLGACQQRFGEDVPLPIWAFPGMARVR